MIPRVTVILLQKIRTPFISLLALISQETEDILANRILNLAALVLGGIGLYDCIFQNLLWKYKELVIISICVKNLLLSTSLSVLAMLTGFDHLPVHQAGLSLLLIYFVWVEHCLEQKAFKKFNVVNFIERLFLIMSAIILVPNGQVAYFIVIYILRQVSCFDTRHQKQIMNPEVLLILLEGLSFSYIDASTVSHAKLIRNYLYSFELVCLFLKIRTVTLNTPEKIQPEAKEISSLDYV